MHALDRYPQLLDKRKRNILLKIALMFQELGHPWDCEHVLLKIAGMHKMSALPSQEDPFHLLANSSFPSSSMSIRRVLVDRWNETVGGNHFDSNLNVPPLHVAVQNRNPRIIMALLSDPDDYSSSTPTPSLTASLNPRQVRANIEERDLNSRTPLLAAVAIGDEACSSILLMHGANVNIRDDHGHTALEVAVIGGHLNVVKTLIKFHAPVNPESIPNCSSLPLHAAIESNNYQPEIINHLLNSGADVHLRRSTDNKNAFDLAIDRGHLDLVESMGMISSLSRAPFGIQEPFMIQDFTMGQIVP